MARATGNYDPEKYGQSFERIPEGVHDMGITGGEECYSDRSNEPQWMLIMQPVDPRYQTENGYKIWLNQDGCIEALFDAMGANPRSVDPNRDYQIPNFINQLVSVEIAHRPSADGTKTYANIKKLYPKFSLGNSQGGNQTPPAQQSAQPPAGSPQGGFSAQANTQYQQPPQNQYQQPMQGGFPDSFTSNPADDTIPF